MTNELLGLLKSCGSSWFTLQLYGKAYYDAARNNPYNRMSESDKDECAKYIAFEANVKLLKRNKIGLTGEEVKTLAKAYLIKKNMLNLIDEEQILSNADSILERF